MYEHWGSRKCSKTALIEVINRLAEVIVGDMK